MKGMKLNMKKFKSNKGITGIDATIAIVIIMIFVPLVATLFSNIYNITKKADRKVTATNLAIQAIESIKQQYEYDVIPDGEISNDKIFNGKSGNYDYSSLPKGYNILVIVNKQENYKEVIATISYSENVGDEEIVLKNKIYK